MPLVDGRYGVCRVIQRDSEGERVLAVATPWIGSGEPELSEPLLREMLVLSHHAWSNSPAALWVSRPLPQDFILIGSLEPTQAEKQMVSNSGAAWPWLPIQVLSQWRWDNDRESVLKEDALRHQEKAKQREIEAQHRREYLAKITLKELREKPRFGSWEGYVPDVALEATRNVFCDTIDAIVELGPKASEESIIEKLKWCIESLNELDFQHEFIETLERENLCAEFEEIVHASNLGRYNNLADRWREW